MSRYVIIGISIQWVLYSFAFPESGAAQKMSIENIKVTIELDDLSVQEALNKLEEVTDFEFAYKRRILDTKKKINLGTQ